MEWTWHGWRHMGAACVLGLWIGAVSLGCLLPGHTARGEDMLRNSEPAVAPPAFRYVPGVMVLLPDGRQTRIVEQTPEGALRTEDGLLLTPEGRLLPPDTGRVTPLPETAAVVPTVPDTGPARAEPLPPNEETSPRVEQERQLWQMIPLTPIPQAAQSTPSQAPDKPRAEARLPEKSAPAKPVREKAAKQPVQPEPKREEAVSPPETKKSEKPRRAKPGEELRIPPEAAKTGNLDFLEGCWQGTRPEYFSKRTIRECFCFGAHGSNGKRRVIDPKGGRMCIGASRARLDSSGVLFVTSEGAACTDGERWGRAEMTCRGKGQRTPCSWVFKDASGGRQSYEIPFVRVEACGRK